MTSERLPDVLVGRFLMTRHGAAQVLSENIQTERLLMETVDNPHIKQFWLNTGTIIPSDLLDLQLNEPEVAEAFLEGNLGSMVDTSIPSATKAEPVWCNATRSACDCSGCYLMSTNGFHIRNWADCRCEEKACPCLTT